MSSTVRPYRRTLEVPIRPGAGRPTHCPWGHDLAVGGVRQSWSQDYRALEWVCEACYALPGRTGVWAVIDPAVERQVPEESVDEYGLRLVVVHRRCRAKQLLVHVRQRGDVQAVALVLTVAPRRSAATLYLAADRSFGSPGPTPDIPAAPAREPATGREPPPTSPSAHSAAPPSHRRTPTGPRPARTRPDATKPVASQ